MPIITIEELHRATTEYVHKAARSLTPFIVTEHGEPIAVLANPALIINRRRKRVLLPEYEALMAQATLGNDVMDALDEVRGD